MSMLIIMIPLSLILVIGAGIAFFWAVNHDQFDDMHTPALLPMSDDLPRHQLPAADESADDDKQPQASDADEAAQGRVDDAAAQSASGQPAPNALQPSSATNKDTPGTARNSEAAP